MKSFFKRYSYNSVKLLVSQIAISVFGAVLAIATAKNDKLLTATSVFAIAFFLFLVYVEVWETGAKDRISIDAGRLKYKPLTGLFIGLLANVVNFIIAILMVVGLTAGKTNQTAGSIGAIARLVNIFIEGMYMGITSVIKINGSPAYEYWITYFIIIIPALVTTTIAYIFGNNDWRLTKMMINENPEARPKKNRFFDGNTNKKD